MTWAPFLLAVVFTLVLYGGALYVSSPSRGELADKLGQARQARMKSHPFRSYYFPLGVFLLAATIALREVIAAQSL